MTAVPRWVRWLLRLGLWSWPSQRRRRHGPQILEAAEAMIGDAGRAGFLALVRATAGEVGALVAEGTKSRLVTLWPLGWRGRARSSWKTRLVAVLGDMGLAARRLLRSPGVTAAGATTLALGIGVAAATMSLVDHILFQNSGYEAPERLVVIWNRVTGSDDRIAVAAPDAGLIRDRTTTLSDVAFTNRVTDGSIAATQGDAVEHVRVAAVSENFFQVLGVAPSAGRYFGPDDGPAGVEGPAGSSPPSVVISEELWQRVFGGAAGVVGSTVRLNGRPADVVGVASRGFRFDLSPEAGIDPDVDVWVALRLPLSAFRRVDGRRLDQDSDNTGAAVARLRPGGTLEAAQTELDRFASDLRKAVPAYAAVELGFDARPLRSDATRHARPVLLTLLVGAGGVLVIACLNLVVLLLARSMDRGREVAIRVALGASRGRVVRQLMAESTLLVAVGTIAGVAVAALALDGVRALAPSSYPTAGLEVDVRALAFAAAVGAACAFLCGLVPALRADDGTGLGSVAAGGRAVGRDRGEARLRGGLMVVQVALTALLLGGAGLLNGTVRSLRAVDPGFEPSGALAFSVSLRVPDAYRAPGERAALMRELEERVATLPGVESVGLVGVLPLGGDRWTQPYGLPGQAESEWSAQRADFRVATSGYFDAVGTRVLAGRSFSRSEDLLEEGRVVVVDALMAQRIAGDAGEGRGAPVYEEVLGAVIGVPVDGAPVEARIVGVVEHVRHDQLDRDGREAVYVPYRQEASRDVSFVVRTDPRLPAGASAALLPEIRAAVSRLDPRLPIYGLRTLDQYVADAVAPRRFALFVAGTFAALALAAASLGLYSVLSYEVGRRTREIGVRMALGADRLGVLRRFLGLGLGLGLSGLILAGVLLLFLRPGLDTLVYGRAPTDPVTWTAVVGVVIAVVLVATAVPALRASRSDPAWALRPE